MINNQTINSFGPDIPNNYSKYSIVSTPSASNKNYRQCNFPNFPLKTNSAIDNNPEVPFIPNYCDWNEKYKCSKNPIFKCSDYVNNYELDSNKIGYRSTKVLEQINQTELEREPIIITKNNNNLSDNDYIYDRDADDSILYTGNENIDNINWSPVPEPIPTFNNINSLKENFEQVNAPLRDKYVVFSNLSSKKLSAPNGFQLPDSPLRFQRVCDFNEIKNIPIEKEKSYHLTNIPDYNSDYLIQKTHMKENFTCPEQNEFDTMYIKILESYAIALSNYVNNHPGFSGWKNYWKHLENGLRKNGLNFKRLEDSDADVAYSISKGQTLSFRIRDMEKYIPLRIYVYVLCHECAHIADYDEYGHTPKFYKLMHMLEVAAYQMRLLQPESYSIIPYSSNGQEILTKNSIKQELYDGCDILSHHSSPNFWLGIKNGIKKL